MRGALGKAPRFRGYTASVTRFTSALLLLAVSLTFAQQPAPAPQPQEPPEEDIAGGGKPKEYTFNPLQAAKEIRIGNYYFKKHSYRAAAGRFEEATKWDPNDAEAWLRLGDAQMKAGKAKEAREAWAKYLELKPDGKEAETVRKQLKH